MLQMVNPSQEISLLLETDEHPHVVQYFSKVDDREFIYLALSYCRMTLADCIEAKLQVFCRLHTN